MTAPAAPDATVIETAMDIARRTVWGVMTTVDGKGRPRNRVVHPVWQFEDGHLIGWLTTRRTALKVRHLANNPHVSIAYVAASTDFAYFDCTAEWVADAEGKQACWEAFIQAPEPVRYDPSSIWPDGPASETFAVLRFTPYRVQAGLAADVAQGIRAGLVRLR